jgi:hypothetical protein
MEDRLRADKAAKEKALRNRLAARRRSITDELIKSGLSPVEAASRADSEVAAEQSLALHEIDKDFDDALLSLKNSADSTAEENIGRYRAAHDKAILALEERLAAEKLAKEKALRERLDTRRRQRIGELKQTGLPHGQAEAQASQELSAMLAAGLTSIERECNDALQTGKQIAKDKFDEDVSRYRSAHDKALADLENRLAQERIARQKALRERLDGQKGTRVQQLLDAGESLVDAEIIVEGEIAAEMATQTIALNSHISESLVRQKADILTNHDEAMSLLKSRYDKSIGILEDGFEATRTAEHAKVKALLAKKLAQRHDQLVQSGMNTAQAQELAQAEVREEGAVMAAQIDKQLETAKQSIAESVEADFSDRMREIRAAHDVKLNGLDGALSNRKAKEAKNLQDRLAKRKSLLLEDLTACGKPSEIAVLSAEKAFGDDVYLTKIAELEKRIQDEAALIKRVKEEAYKEALAGFKAQDNVLKELEVTESANMRREVNEKSSEAMEKADSAAADTINAALQASRALKEVTDDELKALRDRHERELAKLNEDHLNKKRREEANLKARLAERQKKRCGELVSSGVAEETAVKLAAKEFIDEDMKQLSELNIQLRTEESKAIAEKNMEFSAAEFNIIETEHQRAKEDAAHAQEMKDQAKTKLDELRRQQEEEADKLAQQLNSKHASQELALRSRLAEKKRQQMAKLEADKASDEQKLAEQERLVKEEHEMLLELKQKSVEDETKEKARVEKEQQMRLEEAMKEAHDAELEAAIMATKEASLNAIREMKERAKDDIQAKELRRIRDLHKQTEERIQRERDSAQSATRGKLEERLAAKKAKKMKELEEQEKAQLAELQKKQQEEQEELERLKKSKTLWKEALQTAMDNAAANGLMGLEREEYCFAETLAKGLVPHKQINEVVERVQNIRHSADMAALLSTQFEERINALKTVVEKGI